MTQGEIRQACNEGWALKDFDGVTGYSTGRFDTDGDGTIVAEIVDENFRRWADILDLTLA